VKYQQHLPDRHLICDRYDVVESLQGQDSAEWRATDREKEGSWSAEYPTRGWLCVKAAREQLFEVLDEGCDEGALRGSSRRADHTFATAIPRAFQHAIA
jgi:hypothetical protein